MVRLYQRSHWTATTKRPLVNFRRLSSQRGKSLSGHKRARTCGNFWRRHADRQFGILVGICLVLLIPCSKFFLSVFLERERMPNRMPATATVPNGVASCLSVMQTSGVVLYLEKRIEAISPKFHLVWDAWKGFKYFWSKERRHRFVREQFTCQQIQQISTSYWSLFSSLLCQSLKKNWCSTVSRTFTTTLYAR